MHGRKHAPVVRACKCIKFQGFKGLEVARFLPATVSSDGPLAFGFRACSAESVERAARFGFEVFGLEAVPF